MNRKNIILALTLISMGIIEPAMAATQPSQEKIKEANSAFETFKNDMRCFRKDGWKKCTPAQKKRIIAAGVTLTALVAAIVGGGVGLVLWRKRKPREEIVEPEEPKKKDDEVSEDDGEIEEKEGEVSEEALFSAIDNSNLDEVKRLLKENVNVNSEDNDGNLPLHKAFDVKDKAIASKIAILLIENGANPDEKTRYGWTSLLMSSSDNMQDVVRLLLEKKVDVNVKSENDYTPLFLAVENNNPALAKILLHHGAEVDQEGTAFRTPLEKAIEMQQPDMVRLLIEKGANVNQQEPLFGGTPLHSVARWGHEGIVRLLIEKGANLETSRSIYPYTPLHIAILGKKEDIARLLVKERAKVTQEMIRDASKSFKPFLEENMAEQ